MRRYFSVIAVCLFVLLMLLPLLARAEEDRSFYIPQVLIDAVVNTDGSMRVTELRTYDFSGQFRGLTQRIKLHPSIKIVEVQVGEESAWYQQEPPGTIDIPGIFFVDQDPSYFYIDWSFSARNEKRTFILTYIVENVVVVHNDVAELYWQFIGDETDVSTSFARVALTLPEGADKEELRAWGHGPLSGEVSISSPTQIVWDVAGLPPRTFLEGRVAFPVTLVPEAGNFSGRTALPGILEEEENWARQANLQRTLARIDYILAPLLLLSILIFQLILRYRSRRKPGIFKGDYFRDLPGSYSPAEAGYLYRCGRTNPEDLTATVLDLVRRGHMSIEEYQGEKGLLRKSSFTDYRVSPGKGRDKLLDHEKWLVSFIFQQASPGDAAAGVTFRDIQHYAKRNPDSFQDFYRRWQDKIKGHIKKHGFFAGVSRPGIIAGVAVTILGVLLVILKMYISGVTALICGPLLIALALLLQNFSVAGADHLAKWAAFRRFLLHFSEMQRSEVPALQVWEHYLVYAVVLGVAKQVLKQLKIVFPQLSNESSTFGATYLGSSFLSSNRFESLNTAVTRSFRSAYQSSASSGTGGGGGFSSGGGGGFGGGGISSR